MPPLSRYGLATPTRSSSRTSLTPRLSALGFTPAVLSRRAPEENERAISGGLLGKILGAIRNVPGDVVEFTKGLGHLVGVGLGDVHEAGARILDPVLPGEHKDRDFRTPEVLAALPGAFEEAYGINPLKGDIIPDIGKVGRSLYHDPLLTAADIYGGASLGGRAWAKTGGRVAAARRLAETGAPGGTIRRVTDAGGMPLVEEVPLDPNPVRAAVQRGIHRITSRDLQKIRPEVKEFSKRFEGIPDENPEKAAARQQLGALVPEFEQDFRRYQLARLTGTERIEHAWLRKRRVQEAVNKFMGHQTSLAYKRRNEDMERVRNTFEDHVRAGRMTEEQLKDFYKYAEGVNFAEGLPKRTIDESLDWVENAGPNLLSPDELAPIRAAFEGLRDYRTRITTEQPRSPQHAARLAEELDATEEYGRQLSERLSLYETDPQHVNPYAELIAKLRWERHGPVKESVDMGYMDFTDQMRAAYGPLMVERQAVRTPEGDIDATEFNVEALFEANPGFWRALRDEFDNDGRVSPVYYPQLDPRRFRPGEFTFPKGGGVVQKAGTAPFKYRGYWNSINEAYLMDDPIEVYTRRAAHMRRVIETQRFIDSLTKQFGRRIKYGDDISPNEMIYNPKAIKVSWRTRAAVDEAIARAWENGLTDEGAIAAGVAEIEQRLNPDEILDTLRSGDQDLWAVPRAVGEHLQRFSNYQMGPNARLYWDSITNGWRTSVLSFSPRWIVNNLLGNIMFLKMQGGSLTDVARSMWGELFGGRARDIEDTLRANLSPEDMELIDQGLISTSEQQITHLGRAASTPVGQKILAAKESRPGKALSHASRFMQNANNLIERHFRRVSFLRGAERAMAMRGIKTNTKLFGRSLATLEKITDQGFQPALVNKAIDEMNAYFNDYRRLSPFERNIVRRFIMPFYSFYKHVALLSLKYPFMHPERAAALRALGEMSREIKEEEGMGPLPSWLEEAVPLGPGDEAGEQRFFTTRGANPFSAVSGFMEKPLSALTAHPITQTAYEQATGRDAFTGRPFTKQGVGTPYGQDQGYQLLFDASGNPVGIEDQPVTVRPNPLEAIARAVPMAEMAYRGVTGREPGFAEPPQNQRSLAQSLGQLAGFPTTEFNVANYQERLERNRRAAAIDALRQMGLMPPPEEEEEVYMGSR